MKNKNPLYVVNEDHIQAANGIVDFIVKKLNLEPTLEILTSLFKFLLEQVNSYPVFVAVKEFIDLIVSKLELFQRVSVI